MRTVKLLLTGVMFALSAIGQRAMAALDNSWTEVTSLPSTTAEMANNYYVFVEQNSGNGLMLQLATGNHQQSSYMGLYFKTAIDDPTSDPTYMFTLETTDGTNFGVRNVQYNTYMLQTEYKAAYFLRTHDQPSLCDWSKWIFAYNADGRYWTIQNFKYPNAGYWGPWEEAAFKDGSELAANKSGDNVGHFKIYAKTVTAVAKAQAEYKVALANAKAVDQSADMNKDVLTALQTAISTYGNVESTVADDYTTATTALTTATTNATASIKAYGNAATILPKMGAWLQTFNFYSASALNTYYTDNKNKYDTKTLTTAEANALTDPTAATGYNKQPALLNSFLRSAWSGSYEVNTWSTEGTTDGSRVVVPFFQSFKGTGGSSTLDEQTITGTLTDLEEGTYAVSILMRLAANDVKAVGATMQVNDGTTVDLTDGTAGGDIDKTHTTYGTFTAIGTVGSDGKLAVKLSIAADNNIGWLAFKDATYKKIEADDLYTRKKTTSGWGTVCLPKAATPVGDTKVYTIAGINSNKSQLVFDKATSMVAGVPYIYYYNGTDCATFVMNGDAVTAPVDGENNLKGVFTSSKGSVADGSYILYSGAWHKVDNSSSFNLGNNRAYISSLEGIRTIESSEAKSMTMNLDDTLTGISYVENNTQDNGGNICNLAGQCVDNNYKGIVVKNGKKYIRK